MEHQLPAPSLKQLGKSFLIASTIAALLLVTFILPAEYNIDLLGTGKALGLDKLAAKSTESPDTVPTANTAGAPVAAESITIENTIIPYQENFLTEQRTIVLEPYDGIELKAAMAAGQRFVFQWYTDGANVYADMHGEKVNATDEFTSYWKQKQQQQAKGAFTAPFAGTHGWYWQNNSDEAITIHVAVSGFFQKLYTP